MTQSTKVKHQRRFQADESNSCKNDKRKFNRNYSEMFGREFDHPVAKDKGTLRSSQYSSTTKWTDNRTEDQGEKHQAVANSRSKMLHEYRSKALDDPN